MNFVPTKVFLTKGVGQHKYRLKSFEQALQKAGVAQQNLVEVSSIGIAIPKAEDKWGYLSEVHSPGMNKQEAADMAEDLAASMLGTTLGLEVDPNQAWSEKEQVYKSSGLIIRTSSVTQTARGKKDLWTTVAAIAMFLFD